MLFSNVQEPLFRVNHRDRDSRVLCTNIVLVSLLLALSRCLFAKASFNLFVYERGSNCSKCLITCNILILRTENVNTHFSIALLYQLSKAIEKQSCEAISKTQSSQFCSRREFFIKILLFKM